MSQSGGQYPGLQAASFQGAPAASPMVDAILYATDKGSGNVNLVRLGNNDGELGDHAIEVTPYGWTGAAQDRLRTPNVFKTGSASASGDNAVWTPTAGKKFRLMGYIVTVTNNVAQAVAGGFQMRFRDNTTDMAHVLALYVPGAAGTVTGATVFASPPLGNGILSAAANNVLNFNLPAATTAGVIQVTVYGTEE